MHRAAGVYQQTQPQRKLRLWSELHHLHRRLVVITDLDVGCLQVADHVSMTADREKQRHIVYILANGIEPAGLARKMWGYIQSCAPIGDFRGCIRFGWRGLDWHAAALARPAIRFIAQCIQLRLQSLTVGEGLCVQRSNHRGILLRTVSGSCPNHPVMGKSSQILAGGWSERVGWIFAYKEVEFALHGVRIV